MSYEVDMFFRDVMTPSRPGHIAITHFKDQLLNAKKYTKIRKVMNDDPFIDVDEDVVMSDY
jgi:hypothetical protein